MNAKLITLNLLDERMTKLAIRIPKFKPHSPTRVKMEKEYEELQFAKHAIGNLKF